MRVGSCAAITSGLPSRRMPCVSRSGMWCVSLRLRRWSGAGSFCMLGGLMGRPLVRERRWLSSLTFGVGLPLLLRGGGRPRAGLLCLFSIPSSRARRLGVCFWSAPRILLRRRLVPRFEGAGLGVCPPAVLGGAVCAGCVSGGLLWLVSAFWCLCCGLGGCLVLRWPRCHFTFSPGLVPSALLLSEGGRGCLVS